MKNATLREYKRRCNTGRKHSWSYRSERPSYPPPRDRDNCKEFKYRFITPASCPITKASNYSHFHFFHLFRSLFSQPISVIFSLFVTFSHLRTKKKLRSESLSHKNSTTSPRPVRRSKLCCNNFFFVSFPFESGI